MMNLRIAGGMVLAVALGATAASAQSYLIGPKGKFRATFLNDLEYDPSAGCFKPTVPYRPDRWEQKVFSDAARAYVDCMERNAKADAEYAVSIVKKGYSESVSEYIAELERGY